MVSEIRSSGREKPTQIEERWAGLDYDVSKEINFCESCVSGKIHRSPFMKAGREPLGLVHSDVCGKISSPSLSHAEYLVVFLDDKTPMCGYKLSSTRVKFFKSSWNGSKKVHILGVWYCEKGLSTL